MKTIYSALVFTLFANVLIIGAMVLVETQTSFLGIQFVTDYFFYALFIQWGLATFFMASTPTSALFIKHSPYKASRVAASMNEDSNEGLPSQVDISLSQKLFISGSVCLLVCILC